jgi:hypothetical protein
LSGENIGVPERDLTVLLYHFGCHTVPNVKLLDLIAQQRVLRWDVLPGRIRAPKAVTVGDISWHNDFAFEQSWPEEEHDTQTNQSTSKDKSPSREINLMPLHSLSSGMQCTSIASWDHEG